MEVQRRAEGEPATSADEPRKNALARTIQRLAFAVALMVVFLLVVFDPRKDTLLETLEMFAFTGLLATAFLLVVSAVARPSDY